MKSRMVVLVGAAAVAVTLGFAAPACADGNDAAFLAALNQAGLAHSGADHAVAAGRAVCDLLNGGVGAMDAVAAVQATNPGFTLAHAAKFAAISASAYCPERM